MKDPNNKIDNKKIDKNEIINNIEYAENLRIMNYINNYINSSKNNYSFKENAFVFEDPQLNIFKELYNNKNSYYRISSHQKHFKNENNPKHPIAPSIELTIFD